MRGGCLCGEARYMVSGYPEPRGVCHFESREIDILLCRLNLEQFCFVSAHIYSCQRAGIAHLAACRHSLDVWVAHLQLDEVAEIASAFPGLTIVVDHFGRPILVGPFNGRAGEVLDDWPCAIERQGADENIFLKLTALSMRRVDRSNPDLPPSSDNIARVWKPWTDTAINVRRSALLTIKVAFPASMKPSNLFLAPI